MNNPFQNFTIFILLINLSCAQEDTFTNCDNICEKATSIEEINNIPAKIVHLQNTKYNLDYIFFDIDPEFLDKEGYSTSNETVLIPCELDKSYTDGMKVIISGRKIDCCNIISLPSIRKSWGCKFEMTSIELAID
jgi:predicted glycosyltransferase